MWRDRESKKIRKNSLRWNSLIEQLTLKLIWNPSKSKHDPSRQVELLVLKALRFPSDEVQCPSPPWEESTMDCSTQAVHYSDHLIAAVGLASGYDQTKVERINSKKQIGYEIKAWTSQKVS